MPQHLAAALDHPVGAGGVATLKILVAFSARPRPLYGCMNLQGTAVAIDERLSAGLETSAGVDQGSRRTREVEDLIGTQFDPFNPELGAS